MKKVRKTGGGEWITHDESGKVLKKEKYSYGKLVK